MLSLTGRFEMVVPRMTGAVTWATWLNTVTGGIFWSVCGVLALWLVIFFYLKQRFSIGTSLLSTTVAITFIAFILYLIGLVSETLFLICVGLSGIGTIILWIGG